MKSFNKIKRNNSFEKFMQTILKKQFEINFFTEINDQVKIKMINHLKSFI